MLVKGGPGHWKELENMIMRILEGHMSNFVFGTVFADGLALLGARPSAGTVIMKCPVCIFALTPLT